MRILHVITTLNRSGAESYLADLAALQVRAGDEVHVFYMKGEGYWEQPLEESGVVIHGGLMRRNLEVGGVLALRRCIRETRPDICHAHMPPAELLLRLARLARLGSGKGYGSCPVVITKHNDEPFCPGPLARLLGRWVIRQANHVIAISEAVRRRRCREELAVAEEKTEAIYYGVDELRLDPGRVAEIRAEVGAGPDSLVVGTVCRLVPQKRVDLLLQAFRDLVESSDRDWRLVIVGSGELEASLQGQAEEFGLAGKVLWAGFQADATQWMGAFDVFALSSEFEGLGLVLLEAMSVGRPVVAFDTSAMPEVVENGVTGLLVEPFSVAALTDALGQLEESELRDSMGERGRERVAERFRKEVNEAAVRAVYHRVMKREQPCAE